LNENGSVIKAAGGSKNKNLVEIYISLISHTNVGKTSLTRTLLRRDIGDVRDEPHVTQKSEAYPFLKSEESALFLWDTPGFGDIRKVLNRLKNEGGATGWILHHVVDRFSQRSLFCSIEALKNIRTSGDLILYLVNGAEDPEYAGYPKLELELLSYFEKKVVVVVNQISSETMGSTSRDKGIYESEWIAKWKKFLGKYKFVVDVLPLDAHHPIPEMEENLLQSIALNVGEEKHEACQRLVDARLKERESDRLECLFAAWKVFSFAMNQAKTPSGEEREDLDKMQEELARMMSQFSESLMSICRISVADQAVIHAEVKDLKDRNRKISEKKAGLWTGFLSGAVSGLTADLIAGGLSFGGGALLGGVSGWLAAYYGTKGFNQLLRSGTTDLRWSDQFLAELMLSLLSLYLRVLHHGRARGVLYFSDERETEFWLSRLSNHKKEVLSNVETMLQHEDESEREVLFKQTFEWLTKF